MSWAAEQSQARQEQIERALREAFSGFIETRSVEVIVFANVSALHLAKAIVNHSSILKPLLATCNIAARAIERDLQIKNLNTYEPRLSEAEANAIAGYMKPFLPVYLEIPALSYIDRIEFIDKEIRKGKGRWERSIMDALNRHGESQFKKRKFESGGQTFELDAAMPASGDVRIGIDVKRIEARRDIHKRCDEIVNKASKLRSSHRDARFAAVIYYPFVDEHINIQNRLSSENIDAVAFANETEESVDSAVQMLLAQLGVAK